MKIGAKAILIFLVLFVVFGIGTKIYRGAKRALPTVPQPTPTVAQQPAPAAAPAAATTNQQNAIKGKVIAPVVLDDKRIVVERGKASLDVYNVTCGGAADDNLPPTPVFKGEWTDFDTGNVTYGKKTKSLLTTCTLGNFKFYYQAPEDGQYVWGLRRNYAYRHESEYSSISWRSNGVVLFYIAHWDVATETVYLQKGWYEMDLRFWKNDKDYSGRKGFTLMVKTPSENEMHVITKDEIFKGTELTAQPAASVPADKKGGK